jgi:hypothetical protein
MNDQNKIFINPDGYIEIVLVGEQTGEDFLSIYKQAKPLIEKVHESGKPLYGLCDLSRQSGFTLSSDRVAMEHLEEINYDRMAMYGVPHKEVTKGIIMAIGKWHNTKIFDNREEALKWLLSPASAK